MDRMRSAAQRAMDRIEKLVVGPTPGHSRAIGMGAAMLADLGKRERALRVGCQASLVEPEAVNLQYNIACAMSGVAGDRPRTRGACRDCVEAFAGHGSAGLRLTPTLTRWWRPAVQIDDRRSEDAVRKGLNHARAIISP